MRAVGPARTVAVTGPPGAGKTTLSRALAAHCNAACTFHYDQYQTITSWPRAELEAWMSGGCDPNQIKLDRLVADLTRARGEAAPGGLIVLETPLGRSHSATARLIDDVIWIAVPPDVALARQLAAQAGLALASPDPGAASKFLAWLAGHLRGYEGFLRNLYESQSATVRASADFELDGLQPIPQMVATAAAYLAEKSRRGQSGR